MLGVDITWAKEMMERQAEALERMADAQEEVRDLLIWAERSRLGLTNEIPDFVHKGSK